MAVLEVVFDVPKWVEAGVKAGELKVFGGVVREVGGPIVHHLREAVPRKVKPNKAAIQVAVGAALVAILAGGAYLVYSRFSSKGRALAALNNVENRMSVYLVHAGERSLKLGDAEALSAALETFLGTWRQSEFRDVEVKVSDDVFQKLRSILESLHAFNTAAQECVPALPKPPEVVTDGTAIEPLLGELLGQVRYQESALRVVRAI